jgi:chromatin assembly factor 1 subunit B
VAWSPDSRQIIAGSISSKAIIWDVVTKEQIRTLDDHVHYIQGVAWDPMGQFVCTQSVDRSCRVYGMHKTAKAKGKGKAKEGCLQVIKYLQINREAQGT